VDRFKKFILISIVLVAAISWVLSKDQPDMMSAMMYYNPIAISLFTASWTVGMAAIMFPAITPMVLLYDKLTMVMIEIRRHRSIQYFMNTPRMTTLGPPREKRDHKYYCQDSLLLLI